ncbi:MAG: hypothetical protein UFX20_00135 [Longibaculum muris]|uniref:Uncharacterized protein n=1 Tax=Longibaculum muris TaxID=1796628 RepID=A0A4R3YVD5_9FIRM|nr:hypothetical protein [Longibaculum muris]KXU47451.1 hypothetical protein HMPREF3037_01891 [Candidatus Stoquefichus sp. KLE1796]MBS5367998.1 hypothetical protein [Coprobacillus cateniformis]MCR1888214.1 hypothetical protein [Longibaculum muris]MED9810491.1 hypothetical protein [Longibaculum muris]TCV96540.1 hypothetical protein EDD60_11636 [Longibaculum muris]
MKLKEKKISKMSIAFYIVAGLLFVSFLLTIYNVSTYIMQLLDSGQVTLTDSWLEVILYYVNNTAVFLGLSVLVFGCGYIIQLLKQKNVQKQESLEAEELIEKVNQDEEKSTEDEEAVKEEVLSE